MPERFSVEVINARRLFRVVRTLLRLERRDKRFSKTLLVPSFSTRYQVFLGILTELSRTGLSDEPDTRFSDAGPPMS